MGEGEEMGIGPVVGAEECGVGGDPAEVADSAVPRRGPVPSVRELAWLFLAQIEDPYIGPMAGAATHT
jgi:hypothetical protein